MAWEDAVRSVDGSTLLLLEVRPGASEDRFPDGFDAWRGRIRLRTRAQPHEDAANRAVVAMVARHFGVPVQDVRIATGHQDRRKSVTVPLPRDQVLPRLEGLA